MMQTSPPFQFRGVCFKFFCVNTWFKFCRIIFVSSKRLDASVEWGDVSLFHDTKNEMLLDPQSLGSNFCHLYAWELLGTSFCQTFHEVPGKKSSEMWWVYYKRTVLVVHCVFVCHQHEGKTESNYSAALNNFR